MARWLQLVAGAVLASAVAPVASASDGVLEINQSCALAGCFPGDSAGFPVTGSGGSFVLTSDLVVPDANTSALQMASNSSVDLNGFTISGPTSCTGTPASCTGTGTGSGVLGNPPLTVRNGTIRGMGASGISGEGRFENLLIQGNGGNGISALGARGMSVEGCRILGNGGNGITTSAGSPRGSLVTRNTIFGNTVAGVTGTGLALTDNIIDSNGGLGLSANIGTTQAAYGQNAFYNNNGGNANAQVSGGQSLGGNWCGNASC